MDITKNLANLRKEKHLSQEQMAERLGMSKNGYAKLECGESKINIEHLQNIAQVFDIDIVELFKKDRDFNLLLGDNNTNYANRYYSDKQEIEQLELMIAHKEKLLAQKDKEIALLRQLLDKYTQ